MGRPSPAQQCFVDPSWPSAAPLVNSDKCFTVWFKYLSYATWYLKAEIIPPWLNTLRIDCFKWTNCTRLTHPNSANRDKCRNCCDILIQLIFFCFTVSGGWSSWSSWSSCNGPCGHGIKKRSRVCDNPMTLHGSQTQCPGQSTQTKKCDSECIGE